MNTLLKKFSVLMMAAASFVAISCGDDGGSSTPTPTPTPSNPVVAMNNQFAHRINNDTAVWRSTDIICSYNVQSRTLDISAARGARTNPNGTLLEFQFTTTPAVNGTYEFDNNPVSTNINYLFYGSPTTLSQIDGGVIANYAYKGTAVISNWNPTSKTFDMKYNLTAQAGTSSITTVRDGDAKAIVWR